MKGTEATLDLHGDLNHLCGRFYRMIKWGPFVNNKKLKLVMISEGLKDYYVKKYGVSPDRITVLPDACTLSDYEGISDKPSGNFGERLQIGYFGKTLIGKGIDLIRRLAALDPDNDYEIYGDTKEAAEKETGKPFSDNVHFHGHVRNAEIPAIMCSMELGASQMPYVKLYPLSRSACDTRPAGFVKLKTFTSFLLTRLAVSQ